MKRLLLLVFLLGGILHGQEKVFHSPITEYVTTPADGEVFKHIKREIILFEDRLLLRTFRPEGDTDTEIWSLADNKFKLQLGRSKLVASCKTYLIFEGVRVNAQWNFLENDEGKIDVISRTITNDQGKEPLITRFHID
ncbi:hypothetical protein ML462_07390 [Gramella lutea]|uniref:Uncharacterized protein n=1 Tax=Christiangramia lutea TaxID=1607951 RepID=A0A9X1V375_9FLAO|nr:hypothetical protein [Christiangramia lutea]MCH4822995.1 hypothetical protein [Christiangramia lutea]